MSDVFRALEGNRADREQIRENAARLATTYTDSITTGVGTYVDDTLVLFDTTYTDQPSVVSGSVLLTPQPVLVDPNDPNSGLADIAYPATSAGVWKWELDERGYFIGAYLYFVVGYIGTQGDDQVEIRHHVEITGPAYKILEDLPEIMPEQTLSTLLPPAFNPANYPT